MALALSLKLPVTPPPSISSKPITPTLPLQLPPLCNKNRCKLTATTRNRVFIRKAVEESRESAKSESVEEAESSAGPSGEKSGELGADIKKALMERKEREGEASLLWSGVAEEVKEIEWPVFGKVLGLTGVVIGVIAGSSIVLLTVNFILAELSDRVFAGRGIQDFFG